MKKKKKGWIKENKYDKWFTNPPSRNNCGIAIIQH